MQGLTDPAAAQVREVAEEAIQRARRGEGPTLIEAETYRFRGHSLADPDELRLKEEKEHYQVRARRAARLGAGAAAACMLGAGRTSRVRRGVQVCRVVRLLHKLRGRQARLRARRCEPRTCELLSGSYGGAERDVFLLCQQRVCVRRQGTPDRRRARGRRRGIRCRS